jgi:hypothetical protein
MNERKLSGSEFEPSNGGFGGEHTILKSEISLLVAMRRADPVVR